MTEIFTSFWSNPLLGEVDAVMVSTSRGRPRWSLPFRYGRLDELAPSDEVWNTDEGWRDLYRDQLDRLGTAALLERLAGLSGGKACVLLCYERDPADCHRGVLASWLRGHDVEIRELMPGDLPQRPDSPQPSLFEELTREERG